MEAPLDAAEVRVLGSLIEKEFTTPDNYPLTLSALIAACNQASNRDPVLQLDEATVANSLASLGRRTLAREVYRSDSRARRYRHALGEKWHLHEAELAIMCVLMLRGPQTVGELRTRTARLFPFRDLPHVEVTLDALMTLSTPLVAKLPRRPGQKEARYAHLLSGEPQVNITAEDDAEAGRDRAAAGEDGSREDGGGADRIAALEQELASLRAELAELRAKFDEFTREFQ